VVAQLLEAYPEFAGSWASFRESDMFAPEEPYNHLGRLAEHLVAAMQAANTLGFDRLFGEVEKLLVVATPATRDLLIVGLLEDLQNLSMNRNVGLERWEPWLSGYTQQAWEMLISLWAGHITPKAFNEFVKVGESPAKGEG
jgi:hypothetical protein